MKRNRKLIQIATLLVILAIIVFVNLIFGKLNINIDLTENEIYKISDESKSIITKINKQMSVYCFVDDENKASVIPEFTKRFCKTSNMLNCSVINPIEHPEVAKKYATDDSELKNNTVVFDNGENFKIIPYDEMFSYNYLTGQNNLLVAEERFCMALTALNKESVAKIAFLTGHGEEQDASLEKRVENIGAKCTSIDIRNAELSNIDVVMLISPKIDYTSNDIEKLDSFLRGGGNIIASLDADVPYHEMLESFLAEWGVVVNRNIVFSTDVGSIMGNQPYSVIGKLNSHPITETLIKNNISPVFFASRSVTPLWEARGGVGVSVLAKTSEKSSAVSIDTNEDMGTGEYSLLTLSQGEKGRIFTFGSNLFFNEDLKVYNQDLLENIITWCTDGELMMEISPKIISNSAIKVPNKNIVICILMFGIILPIIIIIAGIIVAIRRKRH